MAQPQAIERAQKAHVALERVAALQTEHEGDFPALVRRFDIGGGHRQQRVLTGCARELIMEVIDDLQGLLQRLTGAVRATDGRVRHPAGGQLGRDAAGAHQGHVGQSAQTLMQRVAPLEGQIQRVAVGNDDGCCRQWVHGFLSRLCGAPDPGGKRGAYPLKIS